MFYLFWVMPMPRTGCSWTVPGLFWTKIVRPLMGPVRDACHAVRILPLRTGPVEFNACIINVRAPYKFRYHKQPMNSPCGTARGPYGQIQPPCGIFANSGWKERNISSYFTGTPGFMIRSGSWLSHFVLIIWMFIIKKSPKCVRQIF